MSAMVAVQAQEWRADATYAWVDNLSRTSFAPDRESGAVYGATETAEWHRQLAASFLGVAQAEGGFEQTPAFPGLDSVHLGGRADLRWKFGLGPYAPVVTFTGGLTYIDVHEHGRSNWKAETGINLSQRLTDTWRVSAGGGWEEDYARDKPFDVRNLRATVEATWDATARLQLSAGAGRLWGELTANAAWDIYNKALSGGSGPVIRDYYNTLAYEHSTAFEDLWWVGASIALTDNTSVPLRFESVDVLNRAQVHYRTEFWSLSIAHRF
jgi:hypothetical protein